MWSRPRHTDWGLRDYGVQGQIGLEPTPEAWLDKMVAVFREVRRVLRDDGTVWLNIGDSYAGGGNARGNSDISSKQASNFGATGQVGFVPKGDGLKPKDLCLIPERLAIRLQEDGWWVRSRIAWCKKSAMPESVTDRPTSAWEHIWLLSKASRYFYDAEAVKTGANLRNWWLLGPEPFPDAHFATFPTEIPRRCIKAGTSQKGVCGACGAPWERVVEKEQVKEGEAYDSRMERWGDEFTPAQQGGRTFQVPIRYNLSDSNTRTTGWTPTCACNAEVVPATVLDPFSGAGTTGVVCVELDRNYIGIELNPEYAAMSEKRIARCGSPQVGLAL